jgi:hypothetical protein
MRWAAAIVVVAVAWSAAFSIHHRSHLWKCGLGYDGPMCSARASWQDPVAIVIATVGLAAAVAIIARRRRNLAEPS